MAKPIILTKEVVKYGNNNVTSYTKKECEIFDISEGDIYEINMNLVKKGEKKKQ